MLTRYKRFLHWKRMLNHLFIFSLVIFIGIACIADYTKDQMVITSGKQQYHLAEPDDHIKLPGRLEEISGLDYLGDGILLCIEDENGILYFYNMNEKEISREIKFAGKGDYEGVAHIGNTAYVISSNGDLYSFPIDRDDTPDTKLIKTSFKSSNDIEGLSAGNRRNELLIACKDNPEVEDNGMTGRTVYSLDTRNNKLDTNPVIQLTSEPFRDALKNFNLKPAHFMPFKPSGIAVHPLTNDIFILASVGKLLIVLNKSGKITSAAPLDRKIFKQPEGICFDDNGRLYISSEGVGKDGYILVYDPMDAE